ncbi:MULTISPECIES: K(+)-transporting ATPase subunit F [Clostridium]|uniref:K(+)-transporting ATPase subunit F n=1 Tax=Clostridium acetobutylicum TaxID=1488 RepID=O32326_CLOAT|nr:hypothetical protein [Clostridium acetobutylicum ATCC 824]AWV82232.1 K(+)-transporting ATPase subunit F [Clostridium acetobutylicum]MCR3760481.1 K(+)-transporting ATPase subunit F [Clostridium felsineum]PSM05788.1 K(+)-transporting ATPase subunit F [Clostridium sp. NJ4]MBC2393954.1 K(+)-transporting ATPase subunit F [Clostridium acetobutylicum]
MILLAIIIIFLFIYLCYALFNPEKF